MTDPVSNNEQVDEQQIAHFGWWVCMLPFVVGAGVFVYLWWLHRAEANSAMNLLYSLVSLVAGVVISAAVSGGGDEEKGSGENG